MASPAASGSGPTANPSRRTTVGHANQLPPNTSATARTALPAEPSNGRAPTGTGIAGAACKAPSDPSARANMAARKNGNAQASVHNSPCLIDRSPLLPRRRRKRAYPSATSSSGWVQEGCKQQSQRPLGNHLWRYHDARLRCGGNIRRRVEGVHGTQHGASKSSQPFFAHFLAPGESGGTRFTAYLNEYRRKSARV